jgi:hypothetical protein
MAADWLDLARYADTNGYQVDRDREMWPWRDWVIGAFNRNLPYDQFTIEQLAGDLLPNATRDQRVATGFHRNAMLNEEGGIIPEEFLVEGIADRVETTGTTWMGLTLGCARCHDHKYDPFTQKEYYQLYAFFNSVAETGIGNYGGPPKKSAPPLLALSTPEQDRKLAELDRQIADLDASAAAAKTAKPEDAKRLAERAAALKKDRTELDLSIPTLMVMQELPQPRETFVLIRGQYRNRGERVTANTPAVFGPMASDLPRSRLGLARWLTDRRHPLTARIAVNRLWQTCFGAPLVPTPEDFGVQGTPPTHPELLDYLALQFAAPKDEGGLGWDMKATLRLILTSATFRQSSRASETVRMRDPENRLLARGPRYRLPAEMIRDQALAAGGLLVDRIGGPSVKPQHPPGLYEQVAATNPTYVPGKGEDLYRRSLYTYWRRSVPHPAMLLFDAPFREQCQARRSRTSTPLQALNLMNDPVYVDAARGLARRMLREGGSLSGDRLAYAFRLILARRPSAEELFVLRQGLERSHADFRADPRAAESLAGASKSDSSDVAPSELAAYLLSAATILNLSEAIHIE